MHYRTLGNTGLRVSAVGMGCWAIGGPWRAGEQELGWGEVDDAISLRTLHAALDVGINFFDTADFYGLGHSEELVGRAFAGRRDRVVIATKFGNRITPDGKWIKDFSPGWVSEAIEGSLRRLRTDYVDVYQLHSPAPGFVYNDEIVDALTRLCKAGKVRFFGVSLTVRGGPEQGLQILESGRRCDVFQVVHNILEREAECALFPAALRAGIGIIARVPLASGFLTGKFTPDTVFPPNDHRRESYPPERIRATVEKVERLRPIAAGKGMSLAQMALRYCISQQAVSVVIPGAKTPEQVRDNARAGDMGPLDAQTIAEIRRRVE
jgi:aryl-alcohol dehydrogenase-like predicted oxidoreductase